MASNASSTTKKRKRDVVLHQDSNGPDTTKPSAVFKPEKVRKHTLSIALPGSIISNAQTHELQTVLAGQVARAAAVFCVDEIIVFNDGQNHGNPSYSVPNGRRHNRDDDDSPAHKHTGWSDPDSFLVQVLSYLETPAHLRKALFPFHQNFRFAGNLPSLDMPHHMRAHEWCRYREGVTIEGDDVSRLADAGHTPHKKSKSSKKEETVVTLVDCGLPRPVELELDEPIPPKTRVTLDFGSEDGPEDVSRHVPRAVPVAPDAPREDGGYYWGYQVRQAESLSAVFTECPFSTGYDVSIGTSERGVDVEDVFPRKKSKSSESLPATYEHLLLVFGGVAGLEAAALADKELSEKGISGANVSEVFDAWVNLVPGQGSRTIRAEEAVWIGLTALRRYVDKHGSTEV